MPRFRDTGEAIAWLRTPQAIRERCDLILRAAGADRLTHFAVVDDRLDAAAAYVVDTIERNYPTLDIPYHARWRHFGVGGVDRWGALAAARCAGFDCDEIARIRVDLVVTSVLLDAGAGEHWRYNEPETGLTLARSEGLAVASFHLFADGGFSATAEHPLRADAAALCEVSDDTLARAFQVSPGNPIAGLAGRAALMRGLGKALVAAPEIFGARTPRVGSLYDYLAGRAQDGALPAATVLKVVLETFAPVWPGRIALGGANLGDVWRHPAARADDMTDRLVPFHKLSQWLTYSLIEPLEEAGLRVTGLDALTALPEYRNGGLLIDGGVLVPKHDRVLGAAHAPGDEVVVEWRALTVALIHLLAERVRDRLGLDAEALPLAKVLEGGTWSAGRRIAAEKRPGGPPPIRLESDGTVF